MYRNLDAQDQKSLSWTVLIYRFNIRLKTSLSIRVVQTKHLVRVGPDVFFFLSFKPSFCGLGLHIWTSVVLGCPKVRHDRGQQSPVDVTVNINRKKLNRRIKNPFQI